MGAGSPVATTVKGFAVPTVKVLAAPLVNEGAELPSTTRLKVCEAVPAGLEADRMNGKVPLPVGVPLTTPVVASRLIPAGKLPTVSS